MLVGRDHLLEHDDALALLGPVSRGLGLHLLEQDAQFLLAIFDGDAGHGISSLCLMVCRLRENVWGGVGFHPV